MQGSEIEKITSTHNEAIKAVISLRKSSKRKKGGQFVIEGKNEIDMAVKSGIVISALFLLAGQYKAEEVEFVGAEKNIELPLSLFEKIAFRENPDGYLAIAECYDSGLKNLKLAPDPLVLVVESVEKPGNLGAILRTADAARVDAVIIADPKVDIFNPNVIRSSLGAVFTVPVAVASSGETINWLRAKQIKILAATPEGAKDYLEANYGGRAAVVIGTEHSGLSEGWLKSANERIAIQMRGQMDSLNASVSAAVIVFEAVRQRNIIIKN